MALKFDKSDAIMIAAGLGKRDVSLSDAYSKVAVVIAIAVIIGAIKCIFF